MFSNHDFLVQALTSTAVKKGGLSTGDVGALYKYKNTLIDVKVDTGSNVCCSRLDVLNDVCFCWISFTFLSSCRF